VNKTAAMHDNMDLDAFIGLERQVWEALRRGDAEADAALLSDDFLGVYPTGFADRAEHAGQLAGGPTVASYELYDARLIVVSDSDAMLCYRADWRRFGTGERDAAEAMYVSSLWSRRGDRWLNTFSHDCVAEQ
jgi:hypothetical protein